MKIALCDKEHEQLKKLKNIIYEYAKKQRLDLTVDCYSIGEDILISSQKYNIIFLGYWLKGANGLEIAKSIRKAGSYSDIIFISQYTGFIFDSLKVSPYGFLISPVSEKEIFEILDEYFAMKGCDYPIWIRSEGSTICLNTGEIFYLEADNKHCLVHLENKFLRSNCTMARIYSVLPKSYFIKINRAFIVNSKYVSRYNKDTVLLKNGKNLRLSRNYSADFKSAYRNFINPLQP